MVQMIEEWKYIEDTDSKYSVSNFGKVRNNATGVILKTYSKDKKFHYQKVDIFINGIRCRRKVHRLVAQSFLPNPQNYRCINHKDENPMNNSVENLEWCDDLYNANYGTRSIRIAQKLSKRVYQYSKNMQLIAVYDSVVKAAEATGLFRQSISAVCLGKHSHTGGYVFRYVSE